MREVGALWRRSLEVDKRLATLSVDTVIRFRSASDRAAFTDELTGALAALAAKYHDEAAPRGRPHRLLVAAYPARGLDIATTRRTQELLLEQRAAGAGVLMVSEDLDELLEMSDRIVVLHDGEVAGVVIPSQVDRYQIGRLMLGAAA